MCAKVVAEDISIYTKRRCRYTDFVEKGCLMPLPRQHRLACHLHLRPTNNFGVSDVSYLIELFGRAKMHATEYLHLIGDVKLPPKYTPCVSFNCF